MLSERRRASSTRTSSFQEDVPQIEVEVDLARRSAYGIKPGDVRRAAATLVAGEEVGDIFRAGKAYDVARLEHARRRAAASPTSEQLPIDTPPAGSVLLGEVARRAASRRPPTSISARATRAGSTSAPT